MEERDVAEAGGERRRVLVVEDSPDVREMIGIVLTGSGYEVATAAHGGDALDVVTRWRPDVIVLDWSMPVMGGAEFARRYHQLPAPHAPILMLTAEADGAQRAAEIAAAGFLGKPFHLPALIRLVSTTGASAVS